MKKTINIKVELAFFAVISLIIAVIVSGFMRDSSILNNKSEEKKLAYVYKNHVNSLKSSLEEIKIGDSSTYKKADRLLSVNTEYIFYVVNKEGEVFLSNSKDVKKIDSNKIKDGKREVFAYKRNKVISEITICDYLKDGYYLYFVFFGYTTSGFTAEITALFIFIIIFTFLSLSRINYIFTIRKSIKIIAQGDLSYRVPLKYRNELRGLAEDINYMALSLQVEEEKSKEFLTNISHDLRTPLTSILGYLNIIEEGKYEDENELENYMDKINKKSLFLKSMLDDFFQYSKLSSKDIEVNKKNICLQELVRQLVEEEELMFEENNLKLSVSLQEELINLEGDGNLLARAIDNLLINALKYSKKNTIVEIKVFKEMIEKEAFAVITVSNVPKEPITNDEVKRFFERLYKKDKSRNQQGSGLGLSIVQEILKIHNGFLNCKMENEKIVFEIRCQALNK